MGDFPAPSFRGPAQHFAVLQNSFPPQQAQEVGMVVSILERRPGWGVREHDPKIGFPIKSCVTCANLLEYQSCERP